MRGGVSGKIFLGLVLAGILFFVVFSVSIDVPMFRRYRLAKERRAELHARNDRLKERLAGLRSNQERFRTDPEFVERLARKNRRLAPGEIVFVFDTPAEDDGRQAPRR